MFLGRYGNGVNVSIPQALVLPAGAKQEKWLGPAIPLIYTGEAIYIAHLRLVQPVGVRPSRMRH